MAVLTKSGVPTAYPRRRCPQCNKLTCQEDAIYAYGMEVCGEACAQEFKAKQDKSEAEQKAKDDERRLRIKRAKEEELNTFAGVHKQESFADGVKAALPKDEEDSRSVHLWRTAQGQGPLPPQDTDLFEKYESLDSFLEAAQEAPVLPPAYHPDFPGKFEHKNLMMRSPVSYEWEGVGKELTFQEVCKFLQSEWNEGASKIEESMESLEAPVTRDIRRRGRWAEDGTDISVDRYLAGDMDRMYRTSRRQSVPGFTRVRIVVDLGSSCGACDNIVCTVEPVDPESLFWRGAAAAALAESLEAAGYSVEIIAGAAFRKVNSPRSFREGFEYRLWDNALQRTVFVPYRGANTAAFAVTVKDFDEPLNAARLASCTASVLLTRRVMLARIASRSIAETDFGTLDQMQNPRVVEALGLEQESNVATVYVNDWVLTKTLANAWVKGTLYGLQYDKSGLELPQEDEG